jgi:hypothetical protein
MDASLERAKGGSKGFDALEEKPAWYNTLKSKLK